MVILQKIKDKIFLYCVSSFTTINGENIVAGSVGAEVKVDDFIYAHIEIENAWADPGLIIESYTQLKNCHIKCNIPKTLMFICVEDTTLYSFPTIINKNVSSYRIVKIIPNNGKLFTYDGITVSDTGHIYFNHQQTVFDVKDPADGVLSFLLSSGMKSQYFYDSLILSQSSAEVIVNAIQDYFIRDNFKETTCYHLKTL